MIKTIAEKHLLEKNDYRGSGYIDQSQINQSLSYHCDNSISRETYQRLVMNDGSSYNIVSDRNSTKGIVAKRDNGNIKSTKHFKELVGGCIWY